MLRRRRRDRPATRTRGDPRAHAGDRRGAGSCGPAGERPSESPTDIPDCRLEVVEARRISRTWSEPDGVTELILEHLSTSPPGEGGADDRSPVRRRHAGAPRSAGRRARGSGDAATTPFTEPFQDFITRSAWGTVWARPGLDRRTRSAITLAVLTALRGEDEIPMHVRAALRHGLSRGRDRRGTAPHRRLRGRPGGQQRVRRWRSRRSTRRRTDRPAKPRSRRAGQPHTSRATPAKQLELRPLVVERDQVPR